MTVHGCYAATETQFPAFCRCQFLNQIPINTSGLTKISPEHYEHTQSIPLLQHETSLEYRKLNIGRAHTRPILHNSYLQCLSDFSFEKTRRLAPGNLGSSPHDHSQGTLLETGKTKSGYIKLLQCPCFDNHSIREHHLIIIDLLGETIGQNNNLLKKIRVARLNFVNYLSLRSSDESRSEHSMGNLVLGEFDESLFFFLFII